MDFEMLLTKRRVLNAQRDQLTAQLNATIGAIAVVDELIAEQTAADVARKAQMREHEASKVQEVPAAEAPSIQVGDHAAEPVASEIGDTRGWESADPVASEFEPAAHAGII